MRTALLISTARAAMVQRNAKAASSGGTPTPTPTPLPAFSLALNDGDSRTANSGGRTVASGTMAVGHGMGGVTSLGLAQAVCGNKWLYGPGYQRAIGGSSTLAMINRQPSASISTTGNPANATTGLANDAQFSALSDGLATALATPGSHVFMLCSVNDGSGGSTGYYDTPMIGYRTLRDVAATIDAYIAAGKFVYLADELPSGNTTFLMESRTVTGGTCTASVTGNFVDGESYGAVGCVGTFASGSPLIRPLTKVPSAPGQDQYTVSAGGVYVFGGIAPTSVNISYTAQAATTATPYRLKMFRAWANSSDANFVYAGNDYGVPGAQYGRPNLRVYASYAGMLDATSGTNEWAVPGTYDNLRLHNNQYGALINARSLKAKIDADYPSAPSLEQRPLFNNWYAARGNNVSTTFTGTLPPTMRFTTPTIVSVNGVQIGTVNTSTGAITGATVNSGTLNFATGVFTITLTGALANNDQLWFEQDIGNGSTIGRSLVMNGMMDLFTATGTNLTTVNGTSSVTGVSNAQIPYGWQLTGAALNTAIANGTASVAVTSDTTPDGYPRFGLTFDGVHTAGMTVTMVQSIANPGTRFGSLKKFIGGYRQAYAAGASGRMYGTRGMAFNYSAFVPSTSVASSTGPQNVTAVGANAADSGTGFVMDDTLLKFGAFDLYRLTPLADFTPFPSVTTATVTITMLNTSANVPFSVKHSATQIQVRERSDV